VENVKEEEGTKRE